MAKTWECELCRQSISEMGAFVKLSSQTYRHVSCHNEIVLEQGREAERREQAEAARQAQEKRDAEEKARREQEEARALALKNQELERARIANLTAQAREALKREQQGEAKDRFALIEIDEADVASEKAWEKDQADQQGESKRPIEME